MWPKLHYRETERARNKCKYTRYFYQYISVMHTLWLVYNAFAYVLTRQNGWILNKWTLILKAFYYRPHTTVKNARNMKSVSQTKLPYLEKIFKFWTHKLEELSFLKMFISFENQYLAVFCVKWISFFLEFLMLSEV